MLEVIILLQKTLSHQTIRFIKIYFLIFVFYSCNEEELTHKWEQKETIEK